MSQVSELPILYNDFLVWLDRADDVRIIGQTQVATPGLRVWLLLRNKWKAFRVTDQLATATQITSTGLSAAAVSNSFPGSLTQALAVRLPNTQQITQTLPTGIGSGRQSCAAATPTALAGAPSAANNFLIKNLDTINPVELGPTGFTPGNGYILETLGTSDDSAWFRNVAPNQIFGAGIGGAVTVCWISW